MRDLVFVSLEDWDEVWRRNQFFCAGLARRHPEMKILFVGLPRNAAQHLRRREVLPLLGNGTYRLKELPNITVTQSLRVGPETYDWGCRINQQIARRHVARRMKELGIRRPNLWLNPHSALHMAGAMGETAVIYDITDDWTAAKQPEPIARRIAVEDEALSRRADTVVVCSQRLFELKRSSARNLHLIPNGVDLEHYALTDRAQGPLPEGAERWERPVLGYMGTIHAERVDLELLLALARRLKTGTLAMVGPIHLAGEERMRLEATGRVVFTGAVPYHALPGYARAFDVCMTPHQVTSFTESLNPIKLWEYLAVGKPIVSTPVAGFRDFPELVALASGCEEFLAAALHGLDESRTVAARRRETARAHSWENRLDAVEAILDQPQGCPKTDCATAGGGMRAAG